MNFPQLHSTISLSRFPGKNYQCLLSLQQPRRSWPGTRSQRFQKNGITRSHGLRVTGTRSTEKNVTYSFTKSSLSLELQLCDDPRPHLRAVFRTHTTSPLAGSALNSRGFQRQRKKMQQCDNRPLPLSPPWGVILLGLHPGSGGSCCFLPDLFLT